MPDRPFAKVRKRPIALWPFGGQKPCLARPLGSPDYLPIFLCMLSRLEKHMFTHLHHVAIICSDYAKSKRFYVHILGFEIEREVFREDRQSYKLDLKIAGQYQIELFSFPNPPTRVTSPEACGLRHIAFEVDDVQAACEQLKSRGVAVEPIRIDEFTGRQFTFFRDPDQLPIEIYER
jgi:glyoxylase I family protein